METIKQQGSWALKKLSSRTLRTVTARALLTCGVEKGGWSWKKRTQSPCRKTDIYLHSLVDIINIYIIHLQYILCKLLDISIHNFVLRQCSIFLISELQKMIYLRPSMHVNATYPKMLHRSSPLDGGKIVASRRIKPIHIDLIYMGCVWKLGQKDETKNAVVIHRVSSIFPKMVTLWVYHHFGTHSNTLLLAVIIPCTYPIKPHSAALQIPVYNIEDQDPWVRWHRCTCNAKDEEILHKCNMYNSI